MNDEYGFLPDPVTLGNLDELSRETALIDEARLYEISDIASAAARFSVSMLNDDIGVYELLSMISESLQFGNYPTDRGAPAAVAPLVSRAIARLSALDRAAFSEAYAAQLSATAHRLTEADFLPHGGRGELIGYVRNPLSDEAFDVFSQDFKDPRVKYYTALKECAAALADGAVDYILLPLEERGGVRLPTVAELIYRYDFKINSVTPVFGFDAGADMKYALVSRHFRLPPHRHGDDRYLELRLPASDGAVLTELLSAAAYFGMSAYRVNTLTFDSEGESVTHFSLVLRDGGAQLTPLLTYLAIFSPDFVPVGVYKNLE